MQNVLRNFDEKGRGKENGFYEDTDNIEESKLASVNSTFKQRCDKRKVCINSAGGKGT